MKSGSQTFARASMEFDAALLAGFLGIRIRYKEAIAQYHRQRAAQWLGDDLVGRAVGMIVFGLATRRTIWDAWPA